MHRRLFGGQVLPPVACGGAGRGPQSPALEEFGELLLQPRCVSKPVQAATRDFTRHLIFPLGSVPNSPPGGHSAPGKRALSLFHPGVARPHSPPRSLLNQFLLSPPPKAPALSFWNLLSLHPFFLLFHGVEWLYFPTLQMGKLSPGLGAMERPLRSGFSKSFPETDSFFFSSHITPSFYSRSSPPSLSSQQWLLEEFGSVALQEVPHSRFV